jgi:hypothetical protein
VVIDHRGRPLDCHTTCAAIEVSPSSRGLALQHAPEDSDDFARILEAARHAGSLLDLNNIRELARIDVPAALYKLRKAGERLAAQILHKANPSVRTATFNDCITAIQASGHMSARSVGYLHTIRVIGNLASHSNDGPLSDVDLRVAAYALAAVVEEAYARRLL